MKDFLKRLALVLCSGYIILYYGEFVFWATPDREGFDVGGLIAMWLLYSIMAYPFLCVTSLARARDPWAVFLAGAFYGWYEEGLVVQTTYGLSETPFPMSISFTALAWHAPLDIWVGWYLLRGVLGRNDARQTLALAGSIGLFYGLWGIFWWNEPPPPMQALLDADRKDLVFLHFVLFAFATTAVLALAYWFYQRVRLTEFKPSKAELGILGLLTIVYFAFITVPAAPRALWVLPPLMGVTLWALSRNRSAETRASAVVAFPETVKPVNYLLLFAIPLVASVVYFLALSGNVRWRTNVVVYTIATPLGALLWLLSVVMCLRKKKVPS